MDMNFALEAIDEYCKNLQDTGIRGNELTLHDNLRTLNNLVWADHFETPDVLKLILAIYEGYASIPNKQPYTDIMNVVRYFEQTFARRAKIALEPTPFRVAGTSLESLLHQLRQCA